MAWPTKLTIVQMSLKKAALPLLKLPRHAKIALVLLLDCAACFFTVWLSLYLRLGEFVELTGAPLWAGAISAIVALPIFVKSGLYRAIFRYSGWPALLTVTRAVGFYGMLYAVVFTGIGVTGVPRTVGLIQPILLLLLVGASRAFARVWLGGVYQSRATREGLPRVLVYGAGASGRQLVAAMEGSQRMRVAGFLDDDERLHGRVLNGQTVHSPRRLHELVEALAISDVLLALPSVGRKRRREILDVIAHPKVAVRTLPNLTDLAAGKVSISDVKDLDIDDLLGRDPVPPIASLLSKNIVGKTVLVTGAGGSIGSELCRQILVVEPKTLVLVEQNEFALYRIYEELQNQAGISFEAEVKLVPLLASVRDEERMGAILGTWCPETVYHAAAYKHVPLVEHNVVEGVRNNLLGTLTVALAARRYGVADFVLISTDKAVRPTNVMGASKRLAEMVLQAMAETSEATNFSMVRFGNVLGSSGSVVPKFRQQIKDGGPITLTHPDINRFFMTIPEAAQLVIQAGAMAERGDVFVLDMGEPVKIMDLAVRMIELSGLSVRTEANPDGDISVEITGLRPGEKLHEELLIGNNPQPTGHPRILKAQEEFLPWTVLERHLETLQTALDLNDIEGVRGWLQRLVSGYAPEGEIVDWIARATVLREEMRTV
ncbi:MAG: 6-dehydratase FlaA1 and capsular polysaccharide biosynthesis protein EpsC [Verrucomicrobia bacterium]|nr:MAG: 6-dehydratase FlaA1 and capsular polysaccharide biosynthesis protein EpsC [Verrucomicrobiota bacterium]